MKRFTMGMTRFDTGESASGCERALSTAQHFLLFPVGTVGSYQWFQSFLNGVLGWLPIILNSLLWAAVILGLIILIGRAMKSQNKQIQPIAGKPGSG
jgi:hypothetical protein